MRGIGVDADQAYLGAHIATSALKKVDVAVFQTVQEVAGRRLQRRRGHVFDVASGAVGIGEISPTCPPTRSPRSSASRTRSPPARSRTSPTTVKG